MVWKLISITINLTIYVFVHVYAKCGLSSSRAYCIFAQPANSNGFVLLLIHDFNNRTFWTFLSVDLRKIQYACDDERPHFCINLNNIDNEVYCHCIVMLTSFQFSITMVKHGSYFQSWNLQLIVIQLNLHYCFMQMCWSFFMVDIGRMEGTPWTKRNVNIYKQIGLHIITL
jgi:hypothetical protein